MNFEELSAVNELLADAQGAEQDNRDKVREVTHFLKKDDGQWEPSIVKRMSGRPRYTFDKCNPVVDSISGEMERTDFGIRIKPAGGDASEDVAKVLDGMVRNIQAMSNARHIYNSSGRKMIESGFDCWRVVQDWADTDSMDQDLFIRKVANAVDRVWFDTGAEMQDMSDANWAFVLHPMTKMEYEERFPEGKGQSVGDDRNHEVYYYKPDFIVVGEFLYKEEVNKELVLMSNGKVYVDDDDFQKVVDELAESGITEERRRKRKSHMVKTRFFDGSAWLSEPKETVFDFIPVVPSYGNFDISENKVIYRGAINKLMDPQRVLNYTESRQIEEGALSPRGKYWMTRAQAEADKDKLATLNTNTDAVQTYTHQEGQPPPFFQGGAQINPGLQLLSQSMSQNIITGSGIFAANQGNAPMQSGIAIELQQNKGDNSTVKYFSSQEIAICHTGRIIVNAIPKVYDTKRIVRVLGEDGSVKMETINDQILDQESGEMVELNDVRTGKYDTTCVTGELFTNRQEETRRAFLEASAINPNILMQGMDIFLNSINAPGMDLMAERSRKQLLQSGQIPDSQMTDDEKEIMKAKIKEMEEQLNQGPSPMDMAMTEQTQANTADIQSKANERQANTVVKMQNQQLDEAKFAHQTEQDQINNIMAGQAQMVDTLNTMADTMNKIRESMGADAIVSPDAAELYNETTELGLDTQERIEGANNLTSNN